MKFFDKSDGVSHEREAMILPGDEEEDDYGVCA